MERDIRRGNMIPGSCDEFTRPEEISALSKYLKQVKEVYDSNLTVNEDNLEVHGRKFIKGQDELPDLMEVLSPRGNEVSSLVSSKEWLDNDKSLNGLEQKRHNLSGTKETSGLDEKNKSLGGIKKPIKGLDEKTPETLRGKRDGDVKLETKTEGIKGASGVNSVKEKNVKLGGDREEIGHLEEGKERIGRLNELLGKNTLGDSTIGLKKESREEILGNLVEKLFGGRDPKLSEKVEPVKGGSKDPNELNHRNIELQGKKETRTLKPEEVKLNKGDKIKALGDIINELEISEKSTKLEERKEKLTLSEEDLGLKPDFQEIKNQKTSPNQLGETNVKIKGNSEDLRYLEKDKETLRDGRIPLGELGKDKERLKDWRENKVEKERVDIPGNPKIVKDLEEHTERPKGTEGREIKSLSEDNESVPRDKVKISNLETEKEKVKGQKEPIEVLSKEKEPLKKKGGSPETLGETLLKITEEEKVDSLRPETDILEVPKRKIELEEGKETLEAEEKFKNLEDHQERIQSNEELESLGGEVKHLYGKYEEPEELRHLVDDRIILERSQVIEELPKEKQGINSDKQGDPKLSNTKEELKLPRQDNPLELGDHKETIGDSKDIKELGDRVEGIKDKRKDPEFLNDTVILVGVEDEDKRKSLEGTLETLKGTDSIPIDALSTRAETLETLSKVDSLETGVKEKIRLSTEKEESLEKNTVPLEVTEKINLSDTRVKLEGVVVNEENKETLPTNRTTLEEGEKPGLEGLGETNTPIPTGEGDRDITLEKHKETISLIQDGLDLGSKKEKLNVGQEEIKLGNTKETIVGENLAVELSETKDRLTDDRELEDLGGYRDEINVNEYKVDNLEDHKEELGAETKVGTLRDYKETRPGSDIPLTDLESKKEQLGGTQKPTDYLESEKVMVEKKPTPLTELETEQVNLNDGRDLKELEDHIENLEDKRDNQLRDYKETLEDTRETSLEDYREDLRKGEDKELENHKEVLEGVEKKKELEEYRETLDGIEDKELENHIETIEDSRIPKLEDHREKLEDKRENQLRDYKETLEDLRENKLEDHQETLEDTRENNLEDYKETIEDPRETKLEDHIENLEDKRDNQLRDYKETLEDTRETSLEDYREDLEDTRNTELEDYQETLNDDRENELEDFIDSLSNVPETTSLYDESTRIKVDGVDPEEKLHEKEDSIQSLGDSLDETLEDFIDNLSVPDKVGEKLRSDYVEGTEIGYEDESTLHDDSTLSQPKEDDRLKVVEDLYDTNIQRPGIDKEAELYTEDTKYILTPEDLEELGDIVINGNWEDNIEKLYGQESLLHENEDNLSKLGRASVNSIIASLKVDKNNDGKISSIEALLSTLYLKLLSKGYIQTGNRIKDDTTKVNQNGQKKTWKDSDGLYTDDQSLRWVEEDNLDKTGASSLNTTIKEGNDVSELSFKGEKNLTLTEKKNKVKILGNTHSKDAPEDLEDYLEDLESGEFREVDDLMDEDTLTNISSSNKGYVNGLIKTYKVDWNGDKKISTFEALLSTIYLKLLSKGFIHTDNRIKDDTTKVNQGNKKKTWSEEDGLYDAVLGMGEDDRTSDKVSSVEDYNIDSKGNDPEDIVEDSNSNTFNPDEDELDEKSKVKSKADDTTKVNQNGKKHKQFDPKKDEIAEEVEEKLAENQHEDAEVEALKKEISEIVSTRNDLGLYYNNILKFADSKQLNRGWAQKVKGLMSSYLSGNGDLSKGRAEQFEMALYKTIIDEDYRDLEKLKPGAGPSELSKDSVEMASYKLPSFNLMGNGLDPTSYLRWVAENTVGKLVHGPFRAILMDETLGLLVLARDAGEKLLKINRDRLPGSDLTSQLLGGGLSLKSVAQSAVKAGAKALFGGGGVDMTLPNNRPDGKDNTTEWKELLSDKTQDPTKGKQTSIKFADSYLKGAGFNTTLKDLIGQSKAPESVESLYSMLRSSSYITNAGKVTSFDYNPLKVQTLDTNQYWEIILRPFTGTENGNKSYLPAISEINTWNEVFHNVKTAYSSWIPITSFELSKAKLSTKTLGLFDGEISYPVSMEFTNEFRLTIADDQYKSWRTYFERCTDTMIYNSEVHDKYWYVDDYDDNWGAMDLNDRVLTSSGMTAMDIAQSIKMVTKLGFGKKSGKSGAGKLTAIDKKYQLVAPYKNVAFRCTIYSMTPQFSTISKYDLLLVLKDFVEERSGDIDGDPGDLSVNFSIVGECPKDELTSMSAVKGDPQDFMKKKTEDVKRKGSDVASIVSSGVNKVIGVL